MEKVTRELKTTKFQKVLKRNHHSTSHTNSEDKNNCIALQRNKPNTAIKEPSGSLI